MTPEVTALPTGPDHQPALPQDPAIVLRPITTLAKIAAGEHAGDQGSTPMGHRRYRSPNPVIERRRSIMLQTLGMAMLLAGAGLMIYKALSVA